MPVWHTPLYECMNPESPEHSSCPVPITLISELEAWLKGLKPGPSNCSKHHRPQSLGIRQLHFTIGILVKVEVDLSEYRLTNYLHLFNTYLIVYIHHSKIRSSYCHGV